MTARAPAEGQVIARPHRARIICWIAAVAVVLIFSGVATALRGPTEGRGVFTLADQIAMAILGLLGAAGILSLTRPRVIADKNGIKLRNLLNSYDLPWNVVREIRFERGAPWATLELLDDDTLPIMAIQAVDKQRAVTAVRGLRGLLAADQGSSQVGSVEAT